VTELSWLLNADYEAAEVMLPGSVPLGDGSRNKGFLELGRGTAKDLQPLFRHSSSNQSVCKYHIQVVW